MFKHAAFAARCLIASAVLGGAMDTCTGVSPPCFAQTKHDLSRPLFPKVESREGDLHILELPPGSQRIDLKELQKQSSEMLREFIQPGMTLRIAFRVDLTNNGEDDVLVLTDNIGPETPQAAQRSEGFVLVDLDERKRNVRKIPIFRNDNANSDFGASSGEYVAYRVGGVTYFACVFYWRATPHLAVVYRRDHASFIEVLR